MKNIFLKIKEEYKNFLKKYLLTNIWCVISAILLCLLYKEIIFTTTQEKFIIFDFTLLCCFIFVETFIHKNRLKIIPVIISIIFSILAYKYIQDNYIVLMIYLGVLGLMGILTLGKICKNKEYKLDKYIYKTFVNYIPLYIVESLLFMASLCIGLLFDQLIFNTLDLEITIILLILLYAGVLIPMNLYVFTEVPEIKSIIIDKIITFVFIPITFIFNITMIIYVLKCLFTWSLPEISVFMIIFCIYFITYLTVLLTNNINDENKLINFNNNHMMKLLCINVLMQVFALIVRIAYYGITLSRMICIYIVIFEIVSIVIYFIKKNQYVNKLLDVSFIIVILMTIVPFINIYELPLYYHGGRVIKYIEKGNVDVEYARSSYQYLDNYFDGNDYNKKYIDGKAIEYIESKVCFEDGIYKCDYYYDDYTYEEEKNKLEYQNKIDLDIDISNYKRIKYVENATYEFTTKELKEYKIDKYFIDLYDFCNGLSKLDNDNEMDKYFKENNIIKIDENKDLMISYISIEYSEDIKDNILEINGYVLEK